jgi:hypothetical protein
MVGLLSALIKPVSLQVVCVFAVDVVVGETTK